MQNSQPITPIKFFCIKTYNIEKRLPFYFDREHHFHFRLGASMLNYKWNIDKGAYDFILTFNFKQHFEISSKNYYANIPKKNLLKHFFSFWYEHNYLLWASLGSKLFYNDFNDYYIFSPYRLIKKQYGLIRGFSEDVYDFLSNFDSPLYLNYFKLDQQIELNSFISSDGILQTVFGGTLIEWLNPYLHYYMWITDIEGYVKEFPFITRFYDSDKDIGNLKLFFLNFKLVSSFSNLKFFNLNKQFKNLNFSNCFIKQFIVPVIYSFIINYSRLAYYKDIFLRQFIYFYVKILCKKFNKLDNFFIFRPYSLINYNSICIESDTAHLFELKFCAELMRVCKFGLSQHKEFIDYLHSYIMQLKEFQFSFTTIFLSLYKTNFLFLTEDLMSLETTLYDYFCSFFSIWVSRIELNLLLNEFFAFLSENQIVNENLFKLKKKENLRSIKLCWKKLNLKLFSKLFQNFEIKKLIEINCSKKVILIGAFMQIVKLTFKLVKNWDVIKILVYWSKNLDWLVAQINFYTLAKYTIIKSYIEVRLKQRQKEQHFLKNEKRKNRKAKKRGICD